MAKPKIEKQSLLETVKKLRAILPGKVTKVDETQWRIDDLVLVELNYYCRWSGKDVKAIQRTCNPHSITVSLAPSANSLHRRSRVFRARTISKRKDGSLNLESVATAVNKAIRSYQEHIKKVKEEESKEALCNKRIAEETKRLLSLAAGSPQSAKIKRRSRGGYLDLTSISIQIRLNNPEDSFFYRVTGYALEVETTEAILRAVMSVGKSPLISED